MATTREILAGRAAVELSVRDRLKAGLDAAQGRLQRFAINVAALGISFQSVSAMASRALGIVGNVFTGPADQLQNMADRTGLSVEMLQVLGEAGADAGATLDDVGGSARAMANFLQQVERGGDGAEKTLADLGLTADQLKNATQDQRLSLFANAIAGISDPARKAALAQDVFGRGAMNLLPVLSGGMRSLDAYADKFASLGATKAMDAFGAAVEQSLSGIGNAQSPTSGMAEAVNADATKAQESLDGISPAPLPPLSVDTSAASEALKNIALDAAGAKSAVGKLALPPIEATKIAGAKEAFVDFAATFEDEANLLAKGVKSPTTEMPSGAASDAKATQAAIDGITGPRLQPVSIDGTAQGDAQGIAVATSVASAALKELGLDAAQVAAASKGDRLTMFADALAKVSDPARQAAIAQQIFGANAQELLPILTQGGGALDAYRKRLEETGQLKTAAQISAADDLGDAFGRLKRRLSAVGWSAVQAMAPTLQMLADAAVGVTEAFNAFIQRNPALAKTLGIIAVGAIGATVALATLTSGVLIASAVATAATTVWGVLTAAVGAFGAVMGVVMSPIGLIVGGIALAVVAIGGLVVAFATLTDSGLTMTANLMSSLSALWGRVTQVFAGIFDALATGNLKLAGEIAMAGLFLAFETGWGNIKIVAMQAIAAIGGLLVDGVAFAIGLTATKIDLLIMAWNKLAEGIDGTKIDFSASSLVDSAAKSAKAALTDGAKQTADEVRKGVADAAAELDRLTKQAEAEKKKRADALSVPKTSTTGGERTTPQETRKDIAQHVKSAIGGAFSATVAGHLGRSTKSEQLWGDMVDLQREATEALKGIEKKLDEGKLVVAE